MSDCLLLPHPQAASGVRALGGWEATWMPLGEGEAEGLPQGRGQGWEHIEVPAQQAAVEGRASIWYRTRFPRPDHSGRVLLRFGGAFIAANAWLNGRLLGGHYGYFGPFGFDATPHLRDDNLLVVCCESPVETDLVSKRHILGWLNDGDSRPYPPSAYFSLPEPYRYEVPLGLWRPVELEYVDAVVIDSLRLRPRVEGDVGRLEVEARLRNLDGRQMDGELTIEMAGPGIERPIRLRRDFRLTGGFQSTVTTTISVPGARRWSPWRFGDQNLYRVTAAVAVDGRHSATVVDAAGFSDVVVEAGHDEVSFRAGGRPFFVRGACYLPGFRLDSLSPDRFREDLALARSAGFDALRVHALVLPDEFYRAADEAGILVLADFPLTRSYAYHASGDDQRFFENAVREQVPEMVAMLANRPSIAAWIAHDEPPWLAASADLAHVHTARQNYTLDQEARAAFLAADPTRPALAASGELDAHAWHGWRGRGWEAWSDVSATLVTEFGAQALPGQDSPAWQGIGRRWPVPDADPAWLHAGLQLDAWAEHGVGLPSGYPSLDEMAEASWAYQAELLVYALDQLRSHKFHPTWGAFVYHLVDPTPGIGFGLLDGARHPRPAYAAVAEALAPLRLVADPSGHRALHPFGFAFAPDRPVVVRLVVVNDDPALSGPARLRWTVDRERGSVQAGMDRLRDAVRRKSYSGEVTVDLPTAVEPALLATTLTLPLGAEGEYRLDAELVGPRGRLAEASLAFVVESDPVELDERPQVPQFLAERIAEPASLVLLTGGLRFTLLNRARPATLTGVRAVRVDGRLVGDARVLVDTAGGRVPLGRRVDLPMGQPVRLEIDLQGPPDPTTSTLEVDVDIPGIASGRLLIRRPDTGEAPP